MSKDFKRCNEEIEKYNAVAIEIVKRYGFEVNDLYAASINLLEDAHSDPVHYYTAMGTEVFTNQVLSYIVPELDISQTVSYKEEIYTDKPIGI